MENRNSNYKSNTQTSKTSNRATNTRTQSSQNSTTNEHKHPNQYTKGADDEGAKNSTTRNCR